MFPKNINNKVLAIKRIRIWYSFLIIIIAIFAIRLFYVQILSYTRYKNAALSDQLKEYQIPANRGVIEINDGSQIVPLVLNQTLYTLYVDPSFIKKPQQTAIKIASIIGGNADTYVKKMAVRNSRYQILAKRITVDQSNSILAFKNPGVGTSPQDYRTYPQGGLAAQVLGFVNSDGTGEYGVEQALNKQLAGTPGKVKAITDANGVPLAATKSGNNLILSMDLGMQSQMEQILANQYKATKSQGLSAVIMDPSTGQIKAMANYPSYDPSNYQNVSDPSLFQNAAASNAIEPGSTMKLLTTAAALDQGVIQPNTTFYDPAHWLVDGFNITDIEQDGGARQQNISSLLSLSLNTGAVWLLMQMGGGQINTKGINSWYNYMVNKFHFGQTTNVEQGYESAGYVPRPDISDPSIDLTYANTSFGQGIQITALQEAAAISSVLNGGTYYQPSVLSASVSPDGKTTPIKPKIVAKHVVSPKIGPEMIPLMENVVTTYLHEGFGFMNFSSDYIVGGKTGTAQIAQPGGGYFSNIYDGTYVGFVGGDKVQYVIVVFNTKPNVPGYAGAYGGQPVFADLAHMLINDGYVEPKSH
jgi:stage V sporulation protein D (sporulation-specific penicillin-binding protein)